MPLVESDSEGEEEQPTGCGGVALEFVEEAGEGQRPAGQVWRCGSGVCGGGWGRAEASWAKATTLLAREEATMILLIGCSWGTRDKSGTGQEETKLQNASKLIVHTAIQQAVQQFSQESRPKEKGTDNYVSLQFERGQLTKKHKKK
ncbi:putative uncharacterized protein C18orf42, partial [Ophiophagus hannah]